MYDITSIARVLVIMPGLVAGTAAYIAARYSKDRKVLCFLPLYASFTLLLLCNFITEYLAPFAQDMHIALVLPLIIVPQFVYVLLLWNIAVFPLSLFESRHRHTGTLFFSTAYTAHFLLFTLNSCAWLISGKNPVPLILLTLIYTVILLLTNLWTGLYCIIRYRKSSEDMRSFLKFMLPVPLVFLPLWAGEFIAYGVVFRFLSPLLYLVLSLVLFRYSRNSLKTATGNSRTVANRAKELALSPREEEILALMLDGTPNARIGETLFISPNTVKTHIKSILRKTGCRNRFSLLLQLGKPE